MIRNLFIQTEGEKPSGLLSWAYVVWSRGFAHYIVLVVKQNQPLQNWCIHSDRAFSSPEVSWDSYESQSILTNVLDMKKLKKWKFLFRTYMQNIRNNIG